MATTVKPPTFQERIQAAKEKGYDNPSGLAGELYLALSTDKISLDPQAAADYIKITVADWANSGNLEPDEATALLAEASKIAAGWVEKKTAEKEGRAVTFKYKAPRAVRGIGGGPSSEPLPEGMLTVEQAAAESGYSHVRISDVARKGWLFGATKVNGKWMVPSPVRIKNSDGTVELFRKGTTPRAKRGGRGKSTARQPKPLTQESLNRGNR